MVAKCVVSANRKGGGHHRLHVCRTTHPCNLSHTLSLTLSLTHTHTLGPSPAGRPPRVRYPCSHCPQIPLSAAVHRPHGRYIASPNDHRVLGSEATLRTLAYPYSRTMLRALW